MRTLRPNQRTASRVLWLCLLACFTIPSGRLAAAPQDGSPLDSEGRLVDFNRDVAPIFRKNCLECHNEDEAKADFRIDDPDSVFSYVEAGDLESSTMYGDYLITDDPDYVMPPSGHLSAQDLSVLRVWIEEGAHWPEDAAVVEKVAGETETEAAVEEEAEAPMGLVDRVWAFQGFFHPATVHFPIALFLFGAFFVALGWFWKSLGDQIPLACLLLGAPSAVVASAMGFAFADEKGYGSWTKINMDSEIFWHRWSGVIVALVAMILALIALWALRSGSEKLRRTWRLGLLVTAAMVGLVGHQGGELHYGKEFYEKAINILLGSNEAVADAEPVQPIDEDSSVSSEGDVAESEGAEG
ncbi:MAG: c-type cytochrome domain-containing protein [Planctomycetota bacterium]